MRIITHGSLFSGIGGFDLGFQWAGIETKWQVEIDPFCRKVLTKHWPDIPKYKDVKACGKHNLACVDIVSGGFPCQDISIVGKGEGLDGERSGLWKELHRIITELQPTWAVIENVPMLRTRGADKVIFDLEEINYSCWPIVVGAWAVGAPHKRDRIFMVAHSNSNRLETDSNDRLLCESPEYERITRYICKSFLQTMPLWNSTAPPVTELCGMGNGVPYRVDRIKSLGNSIVPQIPYLIGTWINSMEGNQ